MAAFLEDMENIHLADGAPLTEERMYELCEECLQNKVREPLIRALGEAFTQPAILARCFASKAAANSDEDVKMKDGEFLLPFFYTKLGIKFTGCLTSTIDGHL